MMTRPAICRLNVVVVHSLIHSCGKRAETGNEKAAYSTLSVESGESRSVPPSGCRRATWSNTPRHLMRRLCRRSGGRESKTREARTAAGRVTEATRSTNRGLPAHRAVSAYRRAGRRGHDGASAHHALPRAYTGPCGNCGQNRGEREETAVRLQPPLWTTEKRGTPGAHNAAASGRRDLVPRAACRLGHLTPGFRTCILRCPFCMQCQDCLIDGDACGSGPRTYRDK